jgi:hypothetical protein
MGFYNPGPFVKPDLPRCQFCIHEKPPSVKSVQSVNTTFYTLHTYYLKNIKLETGDGLSTIYDHAFNFGE